MNIKEDCIHLKCRILRVLNFCSQELEQRPVYDQCAQHSADVHWIFTIFPVIVFLKITLLVQYVFSWNFSHFHIIRLNWELLTSISRDLSQDKCSKLCSKYQKTIAGKILISWEHLRNVGCALNLISPYWGCSSNCASYVPLEHRIWRIQNILCFKETKKNRYESHQKLKIEDATA
jgi:hypothetical protein